jgi:hypothetical protein
MMHGAALGVYETGFGLVRRAVLPESDLDDRLLGGCQPLLPLGPRHGNHRPLRLPAELDTLPKRAATNKTATNA